MMSFIIIFLLLICWVRLWIDLYYILCLFYSYVHSKPKMYIHICIFRDGINIWVFFLLFHSFISFHMSKSCFGTAETSFHIFAELQPFLTQLKFKLVNSWSCASLSAKLANLNSSGKLCCSMYCCTISFHFVLQFISPPISSYH